MSRGISEKQIWLLEELHWKGGKFICTPQFEAYDNEDLPYWQRADIANRNANRALRSLERRGLVKCEGRRVCDECLESPSPPYHWSLTEKGIERAIAEDEKWRAIAHADD